MEIKLILITAVILICGLLFGRLGKKVKLPNVTGYLVAGLILGPSFLNFIDAELVNDYAIISDLALAFIAFSVGCEFDLGYFKKVGSAPVVIAIFESFGAIILVTGTLLLCGFDVQLSIMLGAIAAATAPAQTIMVINQYKAKGSLTSMLLSVVAIDDAVALIGFGFAATITKTMGGGTNLLQSILHPIWELVISAVIGFVMAVCMTIVFRHFKKHSNRLCIIIGFAMGTYWLATLLEGSCLLACMCLGGVLANILKDIDDVVEVSENFVPPVYMIFFVISGAGFEVAALGGIGLLGLIYVVVRVIGKMLGAFVGGKLTKQSDKICKWLGPTLMPQAGVALGLIVVAGSVVPEYAPQIRTVILCSTFIYSIVGPVVAKFSLIKAGEIKHV